ncbi:hypothetical protein ACI8AC_15190 [Geodermatophilus sp. SYSU D00758]
MIERESVRPWPACRRREPGTWAHGSAATARRSVGWFALIVNR